MHVYVSRFANKALRNEVVIPVRISLGHPRFKVGYQIQDAVKELMPVGLLGQSHATFKRNYLKQLNKIGLQAITTRLEAIRRAHGGLPLALLCFEDLTTEAWCHRTMFAEWYEAQTGTAVAEYDTVRTGTQLSLL